jgi:glucosamine--fructose-6-phosphate aminotransferase (isomerizing)
MTTNFEAEIRTQGAVLAARTEHSRDLANQTKELWRNVNYLLVAARGSSDNAALYFQYLVGQHAKRVVALATPSLFENGESLIMNGAGVLAISQSGRSPGIVDVVYAAKAQQCPVVGVTNYPESPLGENCDLLIGLEAGPEVAIASTKTFTATAQALAQIASALGQEELEGIDDFASYVGSVVEFALKAELPLDLLNQDRGFTVVGRGVGMAAAAEIALKIREVTGLKAEAYSAADFVHGPIGADGDHAALMLVVTDEMSDELVAKLLGDCSAKGMKTVVVRSPDRMSFSANAEIVLPEQAPNWLIPMGHVVIGQILALRLGSLRGRPIDTAPGLAKVTLIA